MDPKKQKKLEKEEKDFRKKFKVCDHVLDTIQFRITENNAVLPMPRLAILNDLNVQSNYSLRY